MKILELIKVLILVFVLSAAFLLSGCQAQNKSAFNESVKKGVDSIKAGDMEMAQKHIETASKSAKTHKDKRTLQSLQGLVDGANAMMTGDVWQAKANWSEIPDPRFNREVRVKADAMMGVKVPLAVIEKEKSK